MDVLRVLVVEDESREAALLEDYLASLQDFQPAGIADGQARALSMVVERSPDIVLLDPQRRWKITPESLYYKNNEVSCYIGLEGVGYPVLTVLRGNIIAKDGKYIGENVRGEMITRL